MNKLTFPASARTRASHHASLRSWRAAVMLLGCALVLLSLSHFCSSAETLATEARIVVDEGHPWRPPFGLQRVGRPLTVQVEIPADRTPPPTYALVAYRAGKEIDREVLRLTGTAPYRCRVTLDRWPTELALVMQPAEGAPTVLVHQRFNVPPFEAAVVARPATIIHPVDLGTILVPADWLLLAADQTGDIEGAAISRQESSPDVQVTAWFASAPERRTETSLSLVTDQPAAFRLPLPPTPAGKDRDTLHVTIADSGGQKLWQRSISTMLIQQRPSWPPFGAVATRLRYDAPISVRADDGTYSTLDYSQAWDPQLDDVVVALPNGARFVFWRGSSYVPFWAGLHNTGLSYEWAETSPPPDGFTDCVEPLMDKELRYGRVRIIESTPARIHVRWSYQSCDFKYKVWGDSAVEDFYFYPDGFGTRVLTLQSVPTGDYELSEFIILTPAATYPLDVLPPNLVDILFVDGEKRELTFPFLAEEQGAKLKARDVPAIYRVRLHKNESRSAVYYNPMDRVIPPPFAPFFDQGQLVTPTYWGSHWPLARGKTTGGAIDDRVQYTPCHNSVMSWARNRPQPVRTADTMAVDTLGRAQREIIQTWVWLIGMTDADDARLIQWAQSFTQPPSLEVDGGRLETPTYIPERRAIRVVVGGTKVSIKIKPKVPCVNPVFELCEISGPLTDIQLDDHPLKPDEYAWDGKTLWLDTTLTQDARLKISFGSSKP